MNADSFEVLDVAEVQARVAPFSWEFPAQNRAAIDAHWAKTSAEKPKLFNGRILLQHEARVEDGVFHAGYFATDYKDFLAWNVMGFPGQPLRNGFAMAALRSEEGAFLLGEMGPHTVNAGKIYFAAGTPDLDDVRTDGSVDLLGSLTRELQEETGLTPLDITIGEGWKVVSGPGKVAFMKPATIHMPAEAARSLIMASLAGDAEPELSGIVIVRSTADIVADPARMPPFMQAYLRHMFA